MTLYICQDLGEITPVAFVQETGEPLRKFYKVQKAGSLYDREVMRRFKDIAGCIAGISKVEYHKGPLGVGILITMMTDVTEEQATDLADHLITRVGRNLERPTKQSLADAKGAEGFAVSSDIEDFMRAGK